MWVTQQLTSGANNQHVTPTCITLPENDHGVQLIYNLFMYKMYLCTKYKWLLFLLETDYSWLFNPSSHEMTLKHKQDMSEST